MTRGLGERLQWLFEVVAAPVDVDGVTRWRPYTEAELAEHIATTLGEDQATGWDAIERVRSGGPVLRDQLAAIADFFGVAGEFFDVEDVEVISDAILTRALRDCGVSSYLICRTEPPVAERRVQVQTALRELRRPMSTHWWHDDQHQLPTQHDAREPMTEAQLRELCRNLVYDLALRTPFRPDELVARLGDQRGRRIRVRALDLGGTTGVGHLVPTGRADRILVDQAAPAAQRELVIYHEILHLVRGHLDTDESMTCGLISDDTVGRSDWREWEAEVGARELAALARVAPLPNQLVNNSPVDRNIAAAFGFEGAP